MSNKYSTFKREFEVPILKSRQPGASTNDLEKGEARSAALAEITGQFILRRTSEILEQYLPSKTEFVVFCRPSKVQKQIYRGIVSTPAFQSGMETPGNVLESINALKKVCNAPELLYKNGEIKRPELIAGISPGLIKMKGTSGKLRVLDDLLVQIYSSTEEKVVLVSNYTSTMDLLATFITSLGYSYLRLDGTTPISKRQPLVDRFNRSPKSNSFVFLLSAKAGGVGINLIGASRLILYDCDWNPAVDLQAMARVHRDGQKRECFIYRLLTQGTLDEKIFQRQISKTGLADSIVDGKAAASGFTHQELRDLFTLDEGQGCQTHRLLGCGCGGSGLPIAEKEAQTRNDLAALSENTEGDGNNLGKAIKEKELGKGTKYQPCSIDNKRIKKERRDRGDDWDMVEPQEEDDEDLKGSPEGSDNDYVEVSETEEASEFKKDPEDSDDDFGGKAEDNVDDFKEESEDDGTTFIAKHFNTLGSAGDTEALALVERKAKECYDSAGKAKFLSLMRYTHFDTSRVSDSDGRPIEALDEDVNVLPEPDALDCAIEDEVLRKVIRKDGLRIGFVLTKTGHDGQ